MPQRFGPFSFDTDTRRLQRDGTDIHLTPKAFDLLALLIQEAPRVVPKAELHQRLWPDSFVSDATLVGLVKEVRRALANSGGDAPIRTATRVGYAFSAVLETNPAEARKAGHWILRGRERTPLAEGPNVIGREPASTIWVDAAGVSRRHASIVVKGDSATLEDLGSKNGTLLGSRRVTSAVALSDADRIQIAGVVLVFRASKSRASTRTDTRHGRAKSD